MTSDQHHPRVLAHRETALSRWVRIVERDVAFAPGDAVQTFHGVGVADYLAIVALTPEGKIPIVRQFRPMLDAFTWELPAGLLEPGENPEDACRRELLEETGLPALRTQNLGTWIPDTGRLFNRQHVCFVHAGEIQSDFVPEPGMSIELVTLAELEGMIRQGTFAHQLHLAALYLCRIMVPEFK